MNIKLEAIVDSEPTLGRLFQARPAKAKDTFRLVQLKRVLLPIFEDYHAARTALLDQYAHADKETPGKYDFFKREDDEPVLDEKGNPQIDSKALEDFQADYTELIAEELEISVKLFTLTNIDGFMLEPHLSTDEMESIMYLLKVE